MLISKEGLNMRSVQDNFLGILKEKVDIFGFIDANDYIQISKENKFWIDIESLLDNPRTIIVVGMRTIDDVLKLPGKNVAWHNITMNVQLNQVIYELARELNKSGARSFPHFNINQNYTPTTWQDIAKEVMPLKVIAKIAGMGSIGRNNLFIHPEFRTGIRLAAITTSAAFDIQKHTEIQDLCTNCGKCIKNCPSNAITLKGYNPSRCWEHISESQRKWGYAGCANCMTSCIKSKNGN